MADIFLLFVCLLLSRWMPSAKIWWNHILTSTIIIIIVISFFMKHCTALPWKRVEGKGCSTCSCENRQRGKRRTHLRGIKWVKAQTRHARSSLRREVQVDACTRQRWCNFFDFIGNNKRGGGLLAHLFSPTPHKCMLTATHRRRRARSERKALNRRMHASNGNGVAMNVRKAMAISANKPATPAELASSGWEVKVKMPPNRLIHAFRNRLPQDLQASLKCIVRASHIIGGDALDPVNQLREHDAVLPEASLSYNDLRDQLCFVLI